MDRLNELKAFGDKVIDVMAVIQRSPVAPGQLNNVQITLAYLDSMISNIAKELEDGKTSGTETPSKSTKSKSKRK